MEAEFICEFTPTIRMIANRIRKYSSGRCIFLLTLGLVVFVNFTPALIFGGFGLFDIGLFEIGSFLFGVVILLYTIFFPEITGYFHLKNYKKDTSGDGMYRIAFGDTIEVSQGNIRAVWEYSEINYVYHLKYTYELSKSNRLAIMVDPNGFTKGTFEEFKQFLRGKRPDLNIPD